jgi:hypothetical protein
MVLLHFGNMSKDLTLYNTQRFAREVMPRLRSRFSEWEDNWFPREPDSEPTTAATDRVKPAANREPVA